MFQVSKLGKLKSKNENHSVQDVKADDLRQMFLAMTEEVSYGFISTYLVIKFMMAFDE